MEDVREWKEKDLELLVQLDQKENHHRL